MRTAITSLVLVLLLGPSLYATAQVPDVLIYKGSTVGIYSIPLEPYLKNNPRPREFFAGSTALWRGYRATWRIDDGKLRLIKTEVEDHSKEDWAWKNVPLIKTFPELKGEKGPIVADWYTGTLRLPQGKMLRYVHMGFGSLYERELLIRIEKGVVKKEVTLTRKDADPFRTYADLMWVNIGDPIEDKGGWIDARLLSTNVVDNQVKTKTSIKTRGIYSRGDAPHLWVPRTKNTQDVVIVLSGLTKKNVPEWGSHTEFSGTLERAGKTLILHVETTRPLKVGESMHAESYPKMHEKLHGPSKAKPSD